MKTILSSAILFSSLFAFADTNIRALPSVKKTEINIELGGGLAAVQPTAVIKVSIESCAARSLRAETKKSGNIVFVRLVDSNDFDCFGPTVERNYSVQVSSDATGEQYVLLNPIQPSMR